MLHIFHGVIRNSRIVVRLEPGIAHGALINIHAIIVHQTDSATAAATLNGYETNANADRAKPGAHFLIDKDGTIYQTASLEQRCYHIGKIRIRCYEEHKCVGVEKTYFDTLTKDPKTAFHKLLNEGRLHDQAKKYPARYPMNSDSIGVELVGLKLGDRKDSSLRSEYNDPKGPWEVPTDKQQASLQWLIRELLETLHLQRTDIYRHPQVSRKTDNEAADAKF